MPMRPHKFSDVPLNLHLYEGGFDKLPESFLGGLGIAAAEEATVRGPFASVFRYSELENAKRGFSPEFFLEEQERVRRGEPSIGEVPADHPANPILSVEEAREKAEGTGIKIEAPIRELALDILIERKNEEIQRQAALDRIEVGIAGEAAFFGARIIGSLMDPLNVAAGFIPGIAVRSAAAGNVARQLARGIVPTAERLASPTRRQLFRQGLAEGAAGGLLVEPLVLGAAEAEQADYTFADTVLNIAIGSALGGGLHAVFGKPLRSGNSGRVEAMDAADRLAALRAAIVQMSEARQVDVTPIVDVDAPRMSQAKSVLDLTEEVDPSVFDDMEAAFRLQLDEARARGEQARAAGQEPDEVPRDDFGRQIGRAFDGEAEDFRIRQGVEDTNEAILRRESVVLFRLKKVFGPGGEGENVFKGDFRNVGFDVIPPLTDDQLRKAARILARMGFGENADSFKFLDRGAEGIVFSEGPYVVRITNFDAADPMEGNLLFAGGRPVGTGGRAIPGFMQAVVHRTDNNLYMEVLDVAEIMRKIPSERLQEVGLDEGQIREAIRDQLALAGFRAQDFHDKNFGLLQGQPMAVDPGVAKNMIPRIEAMEQALREGRQVSRRDLDAVLDIADRIERFLGDSDNIIKPHPNDPALPGDADAVLEEIAEEVNMLVQAKKLLPEDEILIKEADEKIKQAAEQVKGMNAYAACMGRTGQGPGARNVPPVTQSQAARAEKIGKRIRNIEAGAPPSTPTSPNAPRERGFTS